MNVTWNLKVVKRGKEDITFQGMKTEGRSVGWKHGKREPSEKKHEIHTLYANLNLQFKR